MAIDYNHMRDVAQRLIDANGQPLKFFSVSSTLNDPTKPWKGASTTVSDKTVTVIGVVIPNEEIDDAQSMRRGKATAYIAAEDFDPSDMVLFDRMTDNDGYTWDIHSVNIVNPGGIRVIYEIGLEH